MGPFAFVNKRAIGTYGLHFWVGSLQVVFSLNGVNAILFIFLLSFMGFQFFIVSIPIVSYCKIYGLFLSFPLIH